VSCEEVDRNLDAYVDRELDSESTRAVGEHVSGCPACRRRVAEREVLGRLVRSAPYYPAPDRLRERVVAQRNRSWPVRPLLTWAAAAAVLIASLGGGIAFLRSATIRDEAVVEDVVDSHVRSLMANHLFDVQSTDQHTVKPWFLGRLDFSPPVVDLASIGFPLVGGRLDYLSGRPVAAIVYERRKHTINLFVSPAAGSGSTSPSVRSLRGFHVHRWVRDGMTFWAVSDLNDAELTQFTRSLQGR
jgi:anti-sigma factor RsiW